MAAHARVAELVDAHDSKSCSARSGGSIPSTGTSLRSRSGAKAARRSLGEGGRCKPPRATTGKPAVQFSTKQGGSVGWVERSETHHPFRQDNVAEAMGFTSFYPSYAPVGTTEANPTSYLFRLFVPRKVLRISHMKIVRVLRHFYWGSAVNRLAIVCPPNLFNTALVRQNHVDVVGACRRIFWFTNFLSIFGPINPKNLKVMCLNSEVKTHIVRFKWCD
jgi:hypothetical protein